jgi:hypothetical protein
MKGVSASPNVTSGQVLMNVTPQTGTTAPGTSDWARMTVFSITVDMAFNHDRGVNDGSDGINIRSDGSDNTEHHAPEYTQNAISISQTTYHGTTNNKTVLYTADKDVAVYNRFSIVPNIPGLTLSLEAIAPGASIAGLDETDVSFANSVSTGGKSIAGIVGFIEFDSKSKTSAVVNKEESAFVWKINKIQHGGNEKTNGTGVVTTTDTITFYTVLDVPKDPWNPIDTLDATPSVTDPVIGAVITPGGPYYGYPYPAEDNKMQPWVSVLETMTNAAWCEGKTTVEQIAEAITTNLYEENKFRYETQGARNFQVTVSSLQYFSLTLFHNQITQSGSKAPVGCSDMAWGVKILSNLLGDNLKVVQMGNTINGFDTNPIHAIGLLNPTSTISWSNHVIACRNITTSTSSSGIVSITGIDDIYDACLKLEDGANWVLATGMSFSTYENLLTNDPIDLFFEEKFYIRIE